MAPRRAAPPVDVSSDEDGDDSDFQVDRNHDRYLKRALAISDSSSSSDDLSDYDGLGLDYINEVAYRKCVRKYEKLKKLKKKLSKSVKHKDKKPKVDKNSKDAFTRFSVTSFSTVIASLSQKYRKVISESVLSSLLEFEKCIVPNKFAKWLARNVNWKSGDMLVDGKVISLTKESLNIVLGLPMGGKPFPSDSSVGKSLVLAKFGKETIPQVSFFEDLLVSRKDLSNDEVLICFIMVAMSSFLCTNSSLFPSHKYFGIFEHIDKLNEFDWAGYVVDWQLDAVKSYNKSPSLCGKDSNTLGGCWYYLAVLYLDHVDFGPRQVPDTIPRITVWKGDMIKRYSEMDMVSNGTYGLRPIVDVSTTVYAQKALLLHNNTSSLELDKKFMEKLDKYSGCNLPLPLKINICKLIERHCINCSLSLNLNFSSIALLPSDMRSTFAKMIDHVYKVDLHTQTLVLDLLKMVADSCSGDSDCATDENNSLNANDCSSTPPVPERSNANHRDVTAPVSNSVSPHDMLVADDKSIRGQSNRNASSSGASLCHVNLVDVGNDLRNAKSVQASISENRNNVCQQSSPKSFNEVGNDLHNSNYAEPSRTENRTEASNLSTPKGNVDTVSGDARKSLLDVSNVANFKTPSYCVGSACGSGVDVHPQLNANKVLSRMASFSKKSTNRTSQIHLLRDPLCDITNGDEAPSQSKSRSVSFSLRQNPEKEYIDIGNDEDFGPDLVPPLRKKRLLSFYSQPVSVDSKDDSPSLTQHTPMEMFTLPDSDNERPSVTPKLSPRFNGFPNSRKSTQPQYSGSKHQVSPNVVITGERSLLQSVSDRAKKSEEIYNSQFNHSEAQTGKSGNVPVHSSSNPLPSEGGSSAYKSRDSSTGGKLPVHGPRRVVFPPSNLNDHFVGQKLNFNVTRSEVENYKIICQLASSQYQTEYAVDIGRVRCTFWSMGESLKPGGHVNSYVVSAFCYNLFCKPNGHPDTSKRHYYFPSIGENLLKDPTDANREALQRSFFRSRKARALHKCDTLFYPICFESHWFVFAVNIKDRQFVYLDCFYSKDDPYQVHVRDILEPSFKYWWGEFVNVDMQFDRYESVYPDVPKITNENMAHSGILSLMFIQYWESPRTILSQMLDTSDVSKMRIKVANELLFSPHNNGNKQRVIDEKYSKNNARNCSSEF